MSIETLESRRLLTAAAEGTPSAAWEFVGPDGQHHGTATLVGDILHVTATARNDAIQIGTAPQPGAIYVWVNDATVAVDASRIRGIRIDAGAGNDSVGYHNFNGLVDVPTTILGGAGDDDLSGEHDRNFVDDPIAFRERQPSYAKVVLDGGDGDDRLDARIGDTTLIGGAGNDTIVAGGDPSWTWGRNTVVADPPPADPKPTQPGPAKPTPPPPPRADDDGDKHAEPEAPAEPPITRPAPAPATVFSALPITRAAGTTAGDLEDRIWNDVH